MQCTLCTVNWFCQQRHRPGRTQNDPTYRGSVINIQWMLTETSVKKLTGDFVKLKKITFGLLLLIWQIVPAFFYWDKCVNIMIVNCHGVFCTRVPKEDIPEAQSSDMLKLLVLGKTWHLVTAVFPLQQAKNSSFALFKRANHSFCSFCKVRQDKRESL